MKIEKDYRKELWIAIALDKSRVCVGVDIPIKSANLALEAFDAKFNGENK